MSEQVDIAIVGGGIAGLTAAHRLATRAPSLRIALFESSDRLGGKILTEQIDHPDGRFLVEAGPDAFLTQKPWAAELIDELGLSEHLISIESLAEPVAVLKNARLINLPDGTALIAPTKLGPFLRSPILGWSGKFRTMLEPLIPPRKCNSDESLGSFVRRRLGSGALDWIAEPLAAGVYNADPNRLSIDATFPRFRELERKHSSVIHGLRDAAKQRADQSAAPGFLSLAGGMQTLVDELTSRVGQFSFTNSPVASIEQIPNGDYLLAIQNRLPVRAGNVMLAIPAAQASLLLKHIAPDAVPTLDEMRTVPAGTLTLAFRDHEIARPLAGYGLVMPRREGHPFNALTFSSRKFDGRAPAGWTLLRLFFGGSRSPETMLLEDDRLVSLALEKLRDLIGVESKPAFARCHRWSAGSPQYDVGHLDRVVAIEQSLPRRIQILGSPYTGVGIPDIVHAATSVVDQLISSHLFSVTA